MDNLNSHTCKNATLSNALAGLILCCFNTAVTALELPAVDCVIQPHEVVDLGSPVAGVIEEIMVRQSDQVEIGQPVAKIEDSVEQATVELARARAKVDAQKRIEKINIVYNKKSQQRVDSLYGRQVIAIDNKDAADREAELSELRLSQVEDLQVVRNRELERARELVEQKVIRSTISGFVVEKYKSHGEFVEDQPILRIARLDPLNIEALVPMKYFGVVRTGMLADVNPELGGGELHTAKVTVVDRIGDAASGTFGVTLEMDNPDFKIPAGVRCEVKFLETSEEVLAEAEANNRARTDAAKSPRPAEEIRETATYIVGPFDREAAFIDAHNSIQTLTYYDRQGNRSEILGYMVVAPLAASRRVKEQIERGEIEDYRVLNKQPYAGQYSLGVYSTESRGLRRVRQLAQLGIESSIVTRTQEKNLWWIELVAASEKEPDIDLLKSNGFKVTPVDQFSGQ